MATPAPDDFLGLASRYMGNPQVPILPQGEALPNTGYNILGTGLGLLNPGLIGGQSAGLPPLPLGPQGDWWGGLGSDSALLMARNKVHGAENLLNGLKERANPGSTAPPEVQRARAATAARLNGQQAGQQAGQFANTAAAVNGVPDQYKAFVAEAAQQANLDPALIAAVMHQESSGDPAARSYMGATGLMQLMPPTARGLGVQNINDPRENILAGARYLRQQLDAFGGNLDLALAAYNAGPGAIAGAGNQIPPGAGYDETRRYVPAVRQRYEQLRQQAAPAAAGGNPPAGPAQGFLAEAEKLRGVPYVWGGTQRSGVDCSGLIIVAAQAAGRPLQGRPTAQGIFNQTARVDPSAVQPGDLVFFTGPGAGPGETIGHVGIVTQQGIMLNAPEPGRTVDYANYNSAYWAPKIVGYGRLN